MHATFLEDAHTNQALLLALGKYRNHKEAAELLAEWLPYTPRHAGLALMEIGPLAEPYVLPLVRDRRRNAPGQAVRVLKRIGTGTALKDLEPLTTDRDKHFAAFAKLSIAMIKQREANGGKNPVNPEYKPSTLPPDRRIKDDLDKDLALLRIPHQLNQLKACGRLAKAAFDPERGTVVAEALVAMAGGPEPLIDGAAAGAFEVWVRPETVPVSSLLLLVDSGTFAVRDLTLKALGKYRGNKEAAQCLAELFPFHTGPASAAFKTMGPQAEEFVVPLLDAPNAKVMVAACEVLEQIGTASSVARLERLSKHRDRKVQGSARKAIEAIKKR